MAAGGALLALAVYLLTCAPGLTFKHLGTDGGDLIAAARTLGIPHPPGYPTYTLLAHLATLVPIGDVAWRTNRLSAVAAAAGVWLFFGFARDLLPASRRRPAIALAAALTLAFSTLYWSQAIITEVYALLGLSAALVLWAFGRWRSGGHDGCFLVAAAALGLGLGNHLTLLFLGPALLLLLWPQRRRWARPRLLGPAALLFLAGLSVYAYLPLAAANHPAVSWGAPTTWSRFLWVVTASQYQPFVFGLPLDMIPGRVSGWAGLLLDQFGGWGLLLALAGFHAWWTRDRRAVAAALLYLLLAGVYAFWYNTGDAHVYLLPSLLFLALAWAHGVDNIAEIASRAGGAWQRGILAVLLVTPLLSLGLHWRSTDLSQDRSAINYTRQVLDAAEPGALMIVRQDKPTFALWYALYAERWRTDVAVVSGPLLAYVWYREHARELYPEIEVPEPGSGGVTTDDLVRELILKNYTSRPIYATDPGVTWSQWFDLTPQGSAPLYRVSLKIQWESDG